MSFARIVKGLHEAKDNPDKPTILPQLDKEIVKRNETPFSKAALKDKAQDFYKAIIEEEAKEEVLKKFRELSVAMNAPAKRSKGVISPSTLYGACLRRLYYDRTGEEPSNPNAGKPSASLLRIFDNGSMWHSYIQDMLYRAGLLKEMEVSVKDERTGVSGSGDGVIKLKDKKYLLEIKTINDYSFKKLRAPLEHHRFQASVYAHFLKLDGIIYLYVNKNTQELLEFIEPIHEASKREFLEILRDVNDAVEEGVAPDRSCKDKLSERALNCKYCDLCFKK